MAAVSQFGNGCGGGQTGLRLRRSGAWALYVVRRERLEAEWSADVVEQAIRGGAPGVVEVKVELLSDDIK